MEKLIPKLHLCVWPIIVSLLALLVTSCGNPNQLEEIPEGIVPVDSMISILTDVHIVEGGKLGSKMLGDSLSASVYFDKIYEKNRISKPVFEESFDYYSERPEIMNVIYDKVLENLTRLELNPPREQLHDSDSVPAQ